MAIEDRVPKQLGRPTRHAPSRVRTMLKRLRKDLGLKQVAGLRFSLADGAALTGSELIPDVDEGLAEWTRLDQLLIREKVQRRHIATRLTAFVEFVVALRLQIQIAERKPRRRLTSAEKILAAAKLRRTRELRHTMGRRQKQGIKA